MILYSFKFISKFIFWILLAVAVGLRLYRITADEFLFYDEGMYLNYNRALLTLVHAQGPHTLGDLSAIWTLMFKAALSTPKSLWFLLLNMRAFIMDPSHWHAARIISMLAGFATIIMTYAFAKRYYGHRSTAIGAALILAVLPSHVFYSRLGMQESLSAFIFLAAMHAYVFAPKGFSCRIILSGILFGAVYLTNYRMLIIPVMILAVQLYHDRCRQQKFDLQKWILCCAAFALVVIVTGLLYGGINAYSTLGWIKLQSQDAQGHYHLLSFLSFPYYVFALEHFIFGLLLFSNLWLMFRKQFKYMLPFVLILLQMILFSFAAEKGARYLCVVLAFEAMAVAHVLTRMFETAGKRVHYAYALAGLLCLGLLFNSYRIAVARTDYQQAVSAVLAHSSHAKFISTQPQITSLYISQPENVQALPKTLGELKMLVDQGYRYLIVDPQIFISWTKEDKRFTPHLLDYVETLMGTLKPVAVFPHIEGVLLNRFVLDHSQDLKVSLDFLKNSKGKGRIYIFDLNG